MSYARSPLLVCSITMGTSMVCGSLTLPAHTSSQGSKQGKSNAVRPMRTCGTENPGSSRCGCDAEFYPAHHPASNVRALARWSVSIGWPGSVLAVNFIVTDLDLLFVSDLLQD